MSDIETKYFTTSDYNIITGQIPTAKYKKGIS